MKYRNKKFENEESV